MKFQYLPYHSSFLNIIYCKKTHYLALNISPTLKNRFFLSEPKKKSFPSILNLAILSQIPFIQPYNIKYPSVYPLFNLKHIYYIMTKWSRFNYNELQLREEQLIELSGMKIISKFVQINNSCYLYAQYCGDSIKPKLILLHGYCGASMIFYKILKKLSERFYIIMIDLLGMGRSSRPSFGYSRQSQCENFFTTCLEEFRERENLCRFSIAGHSFGGYVASCYTILYPQYVERLILLSPIGVNEPPPDWNYFHSLKEKDWKFRWVMKILTFFWIQNITPVTIMRKLGPISKSFMKVYSHKKFQTLGSDKEIMESYLEQINLLPGSGELALIYILNPGGVAIKPLWKRLSEIKIPILFFYGDRDWIKSYGAEQTASLNKYVISKIIDNSGHDLYWDNPNQLIDKIFESIDESSDIHNNA